MDTVDPKRRSEIMSRIGPRDTAPELAVRRVAHRLGLRFRLHRKDLPGRPDLVFPRYKLAVFVHGCFWHRHQGCQNCSTPKTRPEFWAAKFAATVARDGRAEQALATLGWAVLTVWECEAEDPQAIEMLLRKALEGRFRPRRSSAAMTS
ncbi:MAG TPA: DNA mismatch endonuclease Vsr [Bradyrhizobium sp.]|nr:DNA mismatch endonuclease Vsr [Bradyrhizobium sp.]